MKESVHCEQCNKPAHGIYKKGNKQCICCLDCAPPMKVVTGFTPINKRDKHDKNKNN